MLQQHAHCAFEQNKTKQTRTKEEHCVNFSITTTTTATNAVAPYRGNVGADELTNKHSMRATTYPITATTKTTTTDGWRSTVTNNCQITSGNGDTEATSAEDGKQWKFHSCADGTEAVGARHGNIVEGKRPVLWSRPH